MYPAYRTHRLEADREREREREGEREGGREGGRRLHTNPVIVLPGHLASFAHTFLEGGREGERERERERERD